MAAVTTTREFVGEDVIEHVQLGVLKHLKQRQRRGVPETSLTLIDRIMMEHAEEFPEPDQFWERVATWYTLAMERTEPRCRGFVASDFFEIVAAHVRNEPRLERLAIPKPPADIERRVQRDAYEACIASISDYAVDDEFVATSNPSHNKW